MPTDTAATCPCNGLAPSERRVISALTASKSATYAPVIAAVRVPPSACSTSQSRVTVRSPSARRSTTARNERPISRWISSVRPPCLPRAASRGDRECVARGSMPYSAVTQPSPRPRRKDGTPSSALAVTSTRVSPNSTSTDPSACRVYPRVIRIGRSSSGARPPDLIAGTDSCGRPAHSSRRGVVRKRSGRLYGALPQVRKRILETSRATLTRLPDARDLQVREPGPESVGAEQQDVTRLQRAATGETHLRKDGIPADATFDVVAHRVRRRLRLGDTASTQQQLYMAVIPR